MQRYPCNTAATLVVYIFIDKCYSGGVEPTICLTFHAMTVLSLDKTVILHGYFHLSFA